LLPPIHCLIKIPLWEYYKLTESALLILFLVAEDTLSLFLAPVCELGHALLVRGRGVVVSLDLSEVACEDV